MTRSSTPGATYLLAGGNWRRSKAPDPLLVHVLQRVGVRSPRVAYVGAASGDDRDFLRWITALLEAAGAGRVVLAPTAGEGADGKEAARILRAADLVFVSGGDVEAGIRVLVERELDTLLRERHAAGVPFCGMSAGSIMLAQSWIRWADPSDDATAEAFACLGVAPALCDTHAEAEEWEELRALLGRIEEGRIGYGIPTGGALEVNAAGAVAALNGPVPRFVRRGRKIRRLPDLRPALQLA